MTPVLILVFGMHPAAAVGTDILFASVTNSAGSIVHGFNDTVEWRVVARLAAGSIPVTILTLILFARVGSNTASTNLLVTWLLGIGLCVTAGILTLRTQIETIISTGWSNTTTGKTVAATVLTGARLGYWFPFHRSAPGLDIGCWGCPPCRYYF